MTVRKRLGVALVLVLGGVLAASGVARAATTVSTIQDTARGSGVGQMQLSAGWNPCSGNCAKAPDDSFLWASAAGTSATIRFTGNKITLYGMKEPWAYIATAAIDGSAAADVDYYAATVSATTVPVFTSPTLPQGTHSLVLTMTNRRNAASSGGMSITLDRAEVSSGSTHASGLPWSDGGFFMHSATQAQQFAEWRGRPVDNIVAFTTRSNWAQQLIPWWANVVPASFVAARDDYILSVPLWTDDGSAGTDADWTELAGKVAQVDPDGYVRLGWEMNCCFSKALDTPAAAAAWRAQFSRAAGLIKAAAPNLRIVFNPNEGVSNNADPNGPKLLADASALYVAGKVDVIALDAYDFYPAYTSATNANQHFTKTYGWNWWYDFARSRGLPFALAEFSVYAGSPASGGDNPAYFSYVYDWLSGKAAAAPGSIAFVSVFNHSEPYCECNVYPTTTNPNAAARYRSIITTLGG